jgi:NADPH2:quinone reductase
VKAIEVAETGGADVLTLVERPNPKPGRGQALVRHEAIGLNFIDIYFRTGLYPMKTPFTPGSEAAGVVEAVGEGVSHVQPGDRVAYAQGAGAYADYAVVAADRLVPVPEGVTLRTAAAALLKGMTAEFLAERIWPSLEPDDPVLVHAAAGGVGGLLTQWLTHKEYVVIAAVGGAAKAEIARRYGAAHVLDYDQDDVSARVREITAGAGVRVVYDSVGKVTFEASLNSLGKRGLLVCYGNASGPPPAVEPGRLQRLGSLFLTRPTLFDYVATPDALQASARALFHMIQTGALKVDIGQTWPLAEARQAHDALEGRKTTRASLLIP